VYGLYTFHVIIGVGTVTAPFYGEKNDRSVEKSTS
jgi:hypothetical protein